MNEGIKKDLKESGFKDKEIDIYLSALELGSASAWEITKKAGLKRTSFYDASQHLIKQGLLIQTYKGKKKYYLAADPEKLIGAEKNKLERLEKSLPYLKSIYNLSGVKPKIRFYEGIDGLKEINNDTLRHNGEILVFSTPKFLDEDGQDFIKKRIEAKIPVRIIIPASKEAIEQKGLDKKEFRETKMLPQTVFTSNVRIGMYENKIFIVNHKEKFGLIIESSDIVEPLKKIFELIWRSGFIIE